jgi:hypothetical protein
MSPLLLLACTGPSDDTASGVAWEPAFDTTSTGALSGVWGAAPDDVWIVGGSDAGAEIYHYDGSTWSPVDAPDVALLVWVYGFAPDDVWAVGQDGAVVHWDGASWTVFDAGTTRDLWGVWGGASNDIWIVGGEVTGAWPLILHYDGTAFTEVALAPEQNLHGGVALFKVWGIGSRTFAVGDLGLIVSWDGTQWVEQFGGALANDDFVSLWGTSEDHIVAVGGRGNGRLATFDGSAWTTQMPSGLTGLNAVYMTDPDTAIVGGIYGYTGTFDPGTSALEADAVVSPYDIHAIWCDGASACYGVGGKFLAPYAGVAIRRAL